MGWSSLGSWLGEVVWDKTHGTDYADSFHEHITKDYGDDAPYVNAVIDHALGAVPVAGWVREYNQSKDRTIMENQSDRIHTELTVGSMFPVVGKVPGAVDAVYHTAEGIEDTVELVVAANTTIEEKDEHGNTIYRDAPTTEKMTQAEVHFISGTVGAVFTIAGEKFTKGASAAATNAANIGVRGTQAATGATKGFFRRAVETVFVKNADRAAKAAAEASEASSKAAAEAARHTSGEASRSAINTAHLVKDARLAEEQIAREASIAAEEAARTSEIALREASEEAAKATTAEAAKAAADKTAKAAEQAVKDAAEAARSKTVLDAATKNANDAISYTVEVASEAARNTELAEQAARKAAENAAKKQAQSEAAKTAKDVAVKTLDKLEEEVVVGGKIGDMLARSNNVRSYIVNGLTAGGVFLYDPNKAIAQKIVLGNVEDWGKGKGILLSDYDSMSQSQWKKNDSKSQTNTNTQTGNNNQANTDAKKKKDTVQVQQDKTALEEKKIQKQQELDDAIKDEAFLGGELKDRHQETGEAEQALDVAYRRKVNYEQNMKALIWEPEEEAKRTGDNSKLPDPGLKKNMEEMYEQLKKNEELAQGNYNGAKISEELTKDLLDEATQRKETAQKSITDIDNDIYGLQNSTNNNQRKPDSNNDFSKYESYGA